ncbi:unnamed protein product [Trichogramma brassicae]|uniref:Uncharacterized protein n=1 Tax=Trichogramma brassicae TaxID=86971 RepID=A0A6H5IYN1_9HYME|nr:unnamed protein product [Trichogramma brassicae]
MGEINRRALSGRARWARGPADGATGECSVASFEAPHTSTRYIKKSGGFAIEHENFRRIVHLAQLWRKKENKSRNIILVSNKNKIDISRICIYLLELLTSALGEILDSLAFGRRHRHGIGKVPSGDLPRPMKSQVVSTKGIVPTGSPTCGNIRIIRVLLNLATQRRRRRRRKQIDIILYWRFSIVCVYRFTCVTHRSEDNLHHVLDDAGAEDGDYGGAGHLAVDDEKTAAETGRREVGIEAPQAPIDRVQGRAHLDSCGSVMAI